MNDTDTCGIKFSIGDGESLPFILSRLYGLTITVNLKDGRYYTGDIVDPYHDDGLNITKDGKPGRVIAYEDIEEIEYA